MAFDRKQALALIPRNIRTHGFHSYLIGDSTCPRFAYTIGLCESLGAELVLAGAVYYMADEINAILHAIRNSWQARGDVRQPIVVEGLGTFTLRVAHPSWTKSLMLGAYDYYGVDAIEAYQIVPDEDHNTIDVPDLGIPWSAEVAPSWRFLHEAWDLDVPSTSHAMVPLDVARGARITHAARWEDDYWEMFAGMPDRFDPDNARFVPIGVLLGADRTLASLLELPVGRAARRGEGGGWVTW